MILHTKSFVSQMNDFTNKKSSSFIDADTGGEGGGTSCTPLKDFEKVDHKNAIKLRNGYSPPLANTRQIRVLLQDITKKWFFFT
jgi:hypothetical protein